MVTRAELMQIFQNILQAQEHIRLLNVYKGVPIAYEASLVSVAEDTIQIKTNPYQIVCLYREHETFIQSPLLPTMISAQVSTMTPAEMQAELGAFEDVPSGVGDRRQVRVQPEVAVKGDIFTPGMGEAYQAELGDISSEGLAIYVPRRNFYPTVYRRGVKITITVRLPGDYDLPPEHEKDQPDDTRNPLYRFSREALRVSHAPGVLKRTGSLDGAQTRRRAPFPDMDIRGNIVNIQEEPDAGRFRVGVRILAGDGSRALIQRFISQRQAEIVRELQAIYALISGA
jgi:hypothetical protein